MDGYDDYCDAIALAQRIFQNYIASLSSSNIPLPVPVLPAHPLEGSHVAKADGLPAFIAESKGFDLQLARMDGMQTLLAYFLKYQNPDKVRVVYSRELNKCWSRLLICKEMCHLLLGTEANATCTAESATELLTTLISDGIPANATSEVRVESVAYYAAMELLVPQQHEGTLRGFLDYGKTNLEIARHFLVPEAVIELRCHNSLAKSIFDSAYQKLSKPLATGEPSPA